MKNLTVEVVSNQINTRRGISKRNGNPYAIHEQEAYLHQGKQYPTQIKLSVDEVNGVPQPYAPGKYNLSEDSVYVDRYGGIAIKPVLIAQAPAVKSA